MAKKSKNQDSNGAIDEAATPSKAKKRKSTAKPKTAARKASAKKTSSRKSGPGGYEPSDDEVRLRAYFIAERRAQMSMEGDASNDWLVARQQLLEEADQRAAAAKPASE